MKNKRRAEFIHSPLKNEMNLIRIAESPRLQMALSNDMTSTFLTDLEWRLKNEQNFNIFIEGGQGTGKSTLAREMKAFTDKLFGIKPHIDDISMSRREFLDRFKVSKQFWTLIIDEDYNFRTQVGSYRISEEFEFVEQSIRIESTNIISCSIASQPHLFTYKFEAFDIDRSLGLNRAIVYGGENRNYSMNPIGYIMLPRSWLDPELERLYDIKKRAFVKKVKDASHRSLFKELDKMKTTFLTKYGGKGYLIKPTIKILVRQEFPEISETEITELVDTIYYEKDIQAIMKKVDEEAKEQQKVS